MASGAAGRADGGAATRMVRSRTASSEPVDSSQWNVKGPVETGR